jgi:hypothetical protein
VTNFIFIVAPLLFHQLPDEPYIDLAKSRRQSYGVTDFDQVLLNCFRMVDCQSIFFSYSDGEFELRCHENLRPKDISIIIPSKTYFLLPFGSTYGIQFEDFDISESVLKEACKLLIVNNIHGN